MSDPENILARWSRLKTDARPSQPGESARGNETAAPEKIVPALPGDQPPFDPASLPPIESIDGKTDLTAFFGRGVPAELKRAALRRGWSTDPAVRDFIGLSENSWDFNAPEGISGFGSLAPGDIQQLLAHAAGDTEAAREAVPISAAMTASDQPAVQTGESAPSLEQLQAGSDGEMKLTYVRDAQQRHTSSEKLPSSDGAEISAQQPGRDPNPHRPSRHRHGGALPRLDFGS
jgi:hypothetical protein